RSEKAADVQRQRVRDWGVRCRRRSAHRRTLLSPAWPPIVRSVSMALAYTAGVATIGRRSGGGAIAAGHPITAAVRADGLAEGGNAIDACIAAGAASWTTEATVTGIGGAGFLLAHDADAGETVAFDFFAAVPGIGWDRPRSAMRDVVLEFGGGTQLFHVG